MKYDRYGISDMAKASPPAPRKENATGKMQQLSGRKDSSADMIDPVVVTAPDDFIGFCRWRLSAYSRQRKSALRGGFASAILFCNTGLSDIRRPI